MKANLHVKLFHSLEDILLRLHRGESSKAVQPDVQSHFKDVTSRDILLITYDVKSESSTITSEDILKLYDLYFHIYGRSILHNDFNVDHPGHPILVFKEENRVLHSLLDELKALMVTFEQDEQLLQVEDKVNQLQEKMEQLGQIYKHYNRKEKLYFPIMERLGNYYTLTRMMWAEDDRIRNLYKGTKGMMTKLPHVPFHHLKKLFDRLETKCREMIFDEEMFLVPIVQSIFDEKHWNAIAQESDAFGYVLMELEERWTPEGEEFVDEAPPNDSKHFPIGGGYLTVKEANAILNHLPLEITFVNKDGVFSYFNEKVQSSDMMLIRTRSSIGRHVSNCHPPKSMSRVMQLIRDLKTKKRSSESMWFKKKDEYIHITYQALFDENGEYLGILEYVQDIQPFINLPREVKKEISKLDE